MILIINYKNGDQLLVQTQKLMFQRSEGFVRFFDSDDGDWVDVPLKDAASIDVNEHQFWDANNEMKWTTGDQA